MDDIEILAICGSLREKSFNSIVTDCLPALAPPGMRIVRAQSFDTIPLYDADRQAKGIPGEVTALGEAVSRAAGVIIVSPEYNYSVPGGLKNALDWISRLQPQPFAGKPVALQSASGGPLGGARMQYHLRQILVFLDALVLNKPEIMIGSAATRIDAGTRRIIDQTSLDLIAKQLVTFAGFVAARAH